MSYPQHAATLENRGGKHLEWICFRLDLGLGGNMRIDYVSRAAFLPALSRAAKEQGAADPLVTLRDVMPALEFLAEYVNGPWCVFEPGDINCPRTVFHTYTTAWLDKFNPRDAALAGPFRMTMQVWMNRHNFRDSWIADNATATLIACIISGMNDRAGVRTLEWMRSFDPECGNLPITVPDDPEWLWERAQSAGAYGEELDKWFRAVAKEIKSEIQFRQAERADAEVAHYAARVFLGESFASIANGFPVRFTKGDGRESGRGSGGHDRANTVAKNVHGYCERIGLTLPTRALTDNN
jgi:hypothetical protein